MIGKRIEITLASLLGAALVVGTSVVAHAEGMATGDQIRATLSGNTLQGSGSKSAYVEYYDPDGTIRGKDYTGKWSVKGDTGCMAYGDGAESCWTAYIDGAAAIWYKDGKVDATGMSIPGNPNNF